MNERPNSDFKLIRCFDFDHQMPLNTPFNVVVLISGRGSNLRSLINKAHNYTISAVISNNPRATGLNFADEAAIESFSFSRHQASSLAAHKQEIYAKVDELNPSLIVLAGFMQILEQSFVEENKGKIINIHPSLLPKFKGLNTHKRALKFFRTSNQKQREHGCTVHFVDYDIDTGPIIAQSCCPILDSDTEESLAARVLIHEHLLFPWVVNEIANRNIDYQPGKVVYSKPIRQEANRLGFKLFGNS